MLNFPHMCCIKVTGNDVKGEKWFTRKLSDSQYKQTTKTDAESNILS